MALPSPKELKKLAAACRSAGITSFKGDGIEFTLGELPSTAKRSAKVAPKDLGENEIESDSLESDALLFWSVAEETPSTEETQ